MDTGRLLVAIVAVLISIVSLIVAQRAAARAKKAEAISHLLGEKETVAFAALKLLRDGLPRNERERALVIAALLQACVFEGSDRARALLYRVVELNRANHRDEFRTAMRAISETLASMDRYRVSEGRARPRPREAAIRVSRAGCRNAVNRLTTRCTGPGLALLAPAGERER